MSLNLFISQDPFCYTSIVTSQWSNVMSGFVTTKQELDLVMVCNQLNHDQYYTRFLSLCKSFLKNFLIVCKIIRKLDPLQNCIAFISLFPYKPCVTHHATFIFFKLTVTICHTSFTEYKHIFRRCAFKKWLSTFRF